MTAITREIWQVGGAGFTSPEDGAVYLLCFHGRAAIVDAGCGERADRLTATIKGYGISSDSVDYLLLTHCHFDHTGGAEAVRRDFDCQVVVHEKDAEPLMAGDSRRTAAHWYGRTLPPLQPDVFLSGAKDRIALGDRQVEAIHVPGHTPGSVVYLVESNGLRVLFGQDVHGPLHPDFGSDEHAYRQSLKRMADLQADVLCEGHYGIIRGAAAVRAFLRSFL